MSYNPTWSEDEPTRAEVDGWKGVVLLEFGADWCPICQGFQPDLKALLAEHPDLRHVKILDGKGKPLGRSFQVKLWPNLVLLKDGEVIGQLARPQAAEARALLGQA